MTEDLRNPFLLGFLAGLLVFTLAPAPVRAAVEAPRADEELYQLPPREFTAVDTFVDAIAVEDEAALIIDTFWQPAIEALVAANPDRPGLARTFGSDRRRTELAMFKPLVAMMLDSHAVELLNPEVRRRLEALQERRSAEYARTRTVSDERDLAFSRQAMRIRSGPATRVNAEFEAMARLARTPDGIALRALVRSGYSWCVGKDPAMLKEQRREAGCARLEKSPALKRLRAVPLGEKLIRVHGAAFHQLAAMVAMGHAAGISLHSLLPPEDVEAAGLTAPADRSLDELVGRDSPDGGGLS